MSSINNKDKVSEQSSPCSCSTVKSPSKNPDVFMLREIFLEKFIALIPPCLIDESDDEEEDDEEKESNLCFYYKSELSSDV